MFKTIGVSLFRARDRQFGSGPADRRRVLHRAREPQLHPAFDRPAGTPQQLFGNAAKPFLNSLVTPGNLNAGERVLRGQLPERVARPSSGVGADYVWQESAASRR